METGEKQEVYATPHWRRIVEFMRGAGQLVPDRPTVPLDSVRLLRARLIIEEALETLTAFGVGLRLDGRQIAFKDLQFTLDGPFDFVGAVDGLADLSVVTIGAMAALGVRDQPILEAVDKNNLEKLAGGHRDEHGKLVKPAGHPPPPIEYLLSQQGLLPPQVSARLGAALFAGCADGSCWCD